MSAPFRTPPTPPAPPPVPLQRPPLRWYHRLVWFLTDTGTLSQWRWFRRIVGGHWVRHRGNCGHSYRNEIHTGWCLDRTRPPYTLLLGWEGDPEEVYPYPPLRWNRDHRANPYDQRGPEV